MALKEVKNVEEFKKILAIQQQITERAQREFINAAYNGDKLKEPSAHVEAEARLLEKYARYPTLTEYDMMPHLVDSEKWGATFGVASLVNSLIIAGTRQLVRYSQYDSEEKPLPFTDVELKDAYVKFLISLDRTGSKITMDRVFAIFAILSEQFGIIWAKDDIISLTVVGRRTLLHLMDAQKFVEEMAASSAEFTNKS